MLAFLKDLDWAATDSMEFKIEYLNSHTLYSEKRYNPETFKELKKKSNFGIKF